MILDEEISENASRHVILLDTIIMFQATTRHDLWKSKQCLLFHLVPHLANWVLDMCWLLFTVVLTINVTRNCALFCEMITMIRWNLMLCVLHYHHHHSMLTG